MLLVIAADLRELPSADFKNRLLARLVPPADEPEERIMSATATPGIKEGFHSITPYLVAEGAAELIDFLKSAFRAKERARHLRPDGTIMHAEMIVGDSVIELGDTNEQTGPRPATLHLYLPDADAVYARAVAAGAESLRAPVDQAYGDREASVRDRFGNVWYIATHQEEVTDEEMMQRWAAGTFTARKSSGVRPVRSGLRTVTPFLHPRGVERLIAFLQEAFGAQTIGEPTIGLDRKIAHADLRIGDSIIELGEKHGEWQPMPVGLHLYVEDCDAVYAQAIQAGGVSIYPPADQPYGERNSAVEDPAGHEWFIATVK
jgi:PhnB protein